MMLITIPISTPSFVAANKNKCNSTCQAAGVNKKEAQTGNTHFYVRANCDIAKWVNPIKFHCAQIVIHSVKIISARLKEIGTGLSTVPYIPMHTNNLRRSLIHFSVYFCAFLVGIDLHFKI